MAVPRLNIILSVIAAEIAAHDWSDAPYRRDGAGHRHDSDPKATDLTQLSERQTDAVRTNVMWVCGQALGFLGVLRKDEIYEWAHACGVDTRTPSGRERSGHIEYGFRFDDDGFCAPMEDADFERTVKPQTATPQRVIRIPAKSPEHPGPWTEVDLMPGRGRSVSLDYAAELVNRWQEQRKHEGRITKAFLRGFINEELLAYELKNRRHMVAVNDLRRWYIEHYLPMRSIGDPWDNRPQA